MDRITEQSSDKELEKPPTLVAEAEGSKGPQNQQATSNMSTLGGDEKLAKMPVLQPNVSVTGTRTKSGRMHKPTRNFNSDDYVVPNLTKRRIPNNSRTQPLSKSVTPPSTPAAVSAASEIDVIRSNLEERYPLPADEETPFTFIISVCFKELDNAQSMAVVDIHTKVKNIHKNWTKGPYKLRDDEIKFLQECILKPEWSRIPVKDWGVLAEALKNRHYRMRKRFSRGGRYGKAKRRREEVVKKGPGNLVQKSIDNEEGNSEEEFALASEDELEENGIEEEIGEIDNSSHSSKLSIRSKDPMLARGHGNSKTPSLTNDESKDVDFDLSLSSVGIDIGGDELKEEMFDDLECALVNESKINKVGHSNSMVAALHATLQQDGGPQFDPSQYEPPALEKDSNIFALEDMESGENSCNFFENIEEPSFGNAETPTGLSDEAFAELEQRVIDVKSEMLADDSLLPGDPQPGPSSSSYRRQLRDNYKSNRNIPLEDDRLDMSAVEIEESSGSVKDISNAEIGNPEATLISTKTALMCALKISEDFLPSSHEMFLERLEEMEKYRHDDLDDIRKMFNMKPSAKAARRKLLESDSKMKQKMPLKVMNGAEKPRQIPYLRSAYAKCKKFLEDETTVIEKLGNQKILAAGRIIDIDYDNYLKESDVEVPYDEISGTMPSLPPPSASNCHAPSCRLGCICSSISEDMPPRKHCGRPRCFFECTCQQILFNGGDDGDIRSRLRPRVSLLNWRAESTEKEKEPMTSYRQMERGTHFIRIRRTAAQPERLRREFVLDGKVVERPTTSVTKERLRTKALLKSSHRHMLAKPDGHGHRFVRIVPGKSDSKKSKLHTEELKKKCTPLSVDVDYLDIDVTEVVTGENQKSKPGDPVFVLPKQPSPATKMSAKDIAEMKSIIQEMTEDCQILALEEKIGFFSWCKGTTKPKVIMYQVMQGDQFRVPWLYLPIPPQGYSWICHYLTSSFEKTDYVYIPEIKCCIPTSALRVNMNTAFVRKKGVVFDVRADGNSPGIGKIYFFPELPKVLICGPFRTDQTTTNPRELAAADRIGAALQHMEKVRLMKRFGDDQSWKTFTSTPAIFPISQRKDNETPLSFEESRRLFAQIYPSMMEVTKDNSGTVTTPTPNSELDWSQAIKFVGIEGDLNGMITLLNV